MVAKQSLTGIRGALAAIVLLSTNSAFAELGSSVDTVQAEQVRMHAALRKVELGTYARHELALPNGGAVHEFSNPAGQVFAVTWRGPGKPDLRSLLGSHFAALQSASAAAGPTGGLAARVPRSLRRRAAVNTSELQIRTGGHMGYFWGVAFLPALAPAGFNPSDLQ